MIFMKKVLVILAIIVVIVAGIFVAKKIIKSDEMKTVSQENVEKNQKENTSNNTINTTINNEISNETQENILQNNEIQENDTKQNPTEEAKTDEEKAIAIAKKKWGEDASVNFVFDHKNENGEFVIAVRNSTTTAAIEWYIVNINTGTCRTR
jgi:uncharacterized protein YpmS